MTARLGITTGRFASPAKNSDGLGHLLPTTWEQDGRRTRPALCGQRRMRWQGVETFDKPGALTDCPDCTARATDLPASRPPVRIAPAALRFDGPVTELAPAPAAVNTQAARTERRAAFRRIVPISPEVAAYVPRPAYSNA